MKTYEVRRNNACPTVETTGHTPYGEGGTNECTCPWLVVSSNTPIQHLTSWNRRELDNLIREMDGGYFDPPNTPTRKNSMFLSPTLQRLLDVAEKDPAAAVLSLLAGAAMHGDSGLPPFDAIAWDAEDACLSLRSGTAGGWRRLWLGHANVEAVTDHDATKAGGVGPVLLWADHPDTAAEVGLPGVVTECGADVDADDYSPQNHPTYAELAAMAQESADVAAASTTAQIMEPMTPMILSVPADEIPNLKPGHPVYDEAVRQSFLSRNDWRTAGSGFIVVPEEATPLADEVAGLLASLPRRTRQQPSQIAQAGAGDYCTCDLNRSYTCPPCRSAAAGAGDGCSCDLNTRQVCDNCQGAASSTPQAPSGLADNECTCAYRGSGPDTYRCRAHPSSGSADSRLSAEGVTFLPPEEPPAALV